MAVIEEDALKLDVPLRLYCDDADPDAESSDEVVPVFDELADEVVPDADADAV